MLNGENIHDKCRESVRSTLSGISTLYESTIRSLLKEDRKGLKHTLKGIKKLNKEVKRLKDNIHLIIRQLDESESEAGPFYVQVVDYLAKLRKKQIKLIKREEAGTKNSVLYFNTITETKSLTLHLINTIKAQRDFTIFTRSNG